MRSCPQRWPSAKASARLLCCVQPKLLFFPTSIIAALIIAPLANYTFNGTRPCDVTYSFLVGLGYYTLWYPILAAVFFTSVYEQKFKLSVLTALVVALIIPAVLGASQWGCDGYVFSCYFDLEPQMPMWYKLGQAAQQVFGPPMTGLVFLLLFPGSCRPRAIAGTAWIGTILGMVGSKLLMMWSFADAGFLMRVLCFVLFSALSLSGTCKGEICQVKSRDNAVYLFLGTVYMTAILPLMLSGLIHAGNFVESLSLPAYVPGSAAVVLLFSAIEAVVSKAFEIILRFGTVDRETSTILLSFPGLMFSLSVKLFFLTLTPFTAGWFLAALVTPIIGILYLGGLLDQAKFWLISRLKPNTKVRSFLVNRSFLQGHRLLTTYELTELSAIQRQKVMFIVHIISADLLLFASIICSVLIIVVLGVEAILLNLFPQVFTTALWTYDRDSASSLQSNNSTSIQVILSFAFLLVLDVAVAFVVGILLNRQTIAWKSTDVLRRAMSGRNPKNIFTKTHSGRNNFVVTKTLKVAIAKATRKPEPRVFPTPQSPQSPNKDSQEPSSETHQIKTNATRKPEPRVFPTPQSPQSPNKDSQEPSSETHPIKTKATRKPEPRVFPTPQSPQSPNKDSQEPSSETHPIKKKRSRWVKAKSHRNSRRLIKFMSDDVVSKANTHCMVHRLSALQWHLPKYVSSMYRRHIGVLLVLWVFCVCQSLALTSEHIYLRKVLKSMLPAFNTSASNMTDLDAFNEFMTTQTNISYDLLEVITSTECFTGRQTCVSW